VTRDPVWEIAHITAFLVPDVRLGEEEANEEGG
jgi:hypothetical protein